MELRDYFESVKGHGVLASADSKGRVDAAIYSRPHVLADGRLALIMRDRLTHKNLESNPHAAYLFVEEGPGYRGKRLFLTKLGEEENEERVRDFCRRCYPKSLMPEGERRFVTYFQVDEVLPLVGSVEK
jgi:hypothetical protein